MDGVGRGRRGRHSADPMLVKALASGASHAEAARAAKVSLRTITRRLADPSFQAQIDEVHARSLDGIVADLAAGAEMGIKTLVELQDPKHPPPVRVAAARVLVSEARRYSEATEAREESAPPGEPEDLESARGRALELIDQVATKRKMQFKASQVAGHAPPNPPSCIDDHAAGECDDCRAWHETAHAIVLEHCIDPEGGLTDTGFRVRAQVWPLRPATIQLLNAAHRRGASRSVA